MPSTPGIWGCFFIMGALNNLVPFGLVVWGQTHIASGLASILNATTPIFSVILTHFLTCDERLNGRRATGILMDWMGVATGMLCVSTVMMTPLALWIEQPWHLSPGGMTLAALFGLAAASTALAYLIYFRVLATAGATNILLVTFLIPVRAILLGYMVLARGWGGMILPGWDWCFWVCWPSMAACFKDPVLRHPDGTRLKDFANRMNCRADAGARYLPMTKLRACAVEVGSSTAPGRGLWCVSE